MDPGDGHDDLEKRKALVPERIGMSGCPDHNVVTAPTELSRLPYNCKEYSATERDI